MHLNPLISHNPSRFCHLISSTTLSSKLRALVQRGQYKEALQLYSREELNSPSISPQHFTFPPLLKACTALSSIHYGKTIHAKTIRSALQFDPYIVTSLVNLYVKCGSLEYAAQVFASMSEHKNVALDVTLWNAIIDGYFKYGQFTVGFSQFFRMQLLGITPDSYTLSILLGACDSSFVAEPHLITKQIHGFIVRNLSFIDSFLETALIGQYASCGLVTYAWHVFQMLEDRHNIVVWNAMIAGLSGNGFWKCSLQLYSSAKAEGCLLTSASFTSSMTACSQGADVISGQRIHSDVIKFGFEFDPFVCTSLLTVYSKCGFVEYAEQVLDGVPYKQTEMYNAMISAYVDNRCEYEALKLFIRLKGSDIQSDSFTVSNVLSACCGIEMYDCGRMVHAELIKRPLQSNLTVLSALVTLYSKQGNLEDADTVFNTVKDKDVVAWGAMISAFCQNGNIERAMNLFRTMILNEVEPDSSIMSSLVSACGLGNRNLGYSIHGLVIKSGLELDVFVTCSLIELYSGGGLIAEVEKIFFLMPYRNLVAWNSMISCYCRNGEPDKSVSLLPQIAQYGLVPDSVSITNALSAVASSAGLLKGKSVHGCLIRYGIRSDIHVENALIDMYIKCGSFLYAQSLFCTMPSRNLITWNSMICGYGSQGRCKEALELFEQMKRSGTKPDCITFLSMITSCSRSGFVNEGLDLFHSMKLQYNIEPKMDHYVNVVDLLGRAGMLKEAFQFIERMPIEPDQSIWQCLLGSCCAHRNTELAEMAAQNVRKIEPSITNGNFVQLLNVYGDRGLWGKAASLRASMKETGMKKIPGCSWIELKNETSAFVSGDSSFPQRMETFEMLNIVNQEMRCCKEEDFEIDESLLSSLV